MEVRISGPEGILILDGVIRESYDPTVSTPEHPIEQGFNVVDHAHADALRFTISGIITQTPFAGLTGAGSVQDGMVGAARVHAVIDYLNNSVGHFMEVSSPRVGVIDEVLLTGFYHDHDVVREMRIDISFMQPIIAERFDQFLFAPLIAPAAQVAFAGQTNTGSQPTASPPSSISQRGGASMASIPRR